MVEGVEGSPLALFDLLRDEFQQLLHSIDLVVDGEVGVVVTPRGLIDASGGQSTRRIAETGNLVRSKAAQTETAVTLSVDAHNRPVSNALPPAILTAFRHLSLLAA